VRFPRSRPAVLQAYLQTRVQEQKLGIALEGSSDELGIASLDDPTVLTATELTYFRLGIDRRAKHCFDS
jgi:hypothetical protein